MIASVVREAGYRTVHNRSGANLESGIASTLVNASGIGGKANGDLGLFEVDEASVSAVVATVQPRVVAFGNLFRDQLDRYGEVAYVAKSWRRAITLLGPETTLVLNADDPNVAALALDAPGRIISIGVDDLRLAGATLEHTADARLCPRCRGRLAYRAVFYSHIGHYNCPNCGFARPNPTISVQSAEFHQDGRSSASLSVEGINHSIQVPIPGLYNLYNALVALGTCLALELSTERAIATMSTFSAAFGRIERFSVGDRAVLMALVKNPIGFNQVLRSVIGSTNAAPVMIAINDNLADGTDVSWLWDVDFEQLSSGNSPIFVSGTRGAEMAMRLAYAGVASDRIFLIEDLVTAFDQTVARATRGQTAFILPTYTAMLALRGQLARRGLVGDFWDD